MKNSRSWLPWTVLVAAALALPFRASGQMPGAPSPLNLFTNLATHLLKAQLNVDFGHLEIYPTNRYTPAVHRLLQVSANIGDATTTNEFPSVFRPLFTWDVSISDAGIPATNFFISGYTNVDSVTGTNDSQLLGPFDLASFTGPGTYFGQPIRNTAINLYDIPWIIGAKKGLPNFNKFSANDSVQVLRLLEVVRAGISGSAATNFISTNCLYNFSVGSAIGVQFWNSYSNAYSNDVVVVWTNVLTMVMMETNGGALAMIASNQWSMFDSVEFDPQLGQPWPGSAPWGPINNPLQGKPQTASFVSQSTNVSFLNGQNYDWYNQTFQSPGTIDWTRSDPSFRPLPHLILSRTHRFRSYMLARDPGGGIYHVIDYVQLACPNSTRDLWYNLQTLGPAATYTNMWSYTTDTHGVPYGVENQIDASRSSDSTRNGGTFHGPSRIPLDMTYWKTPYQSYEIDGFYVFTGGDPRFGLPLALQNATATNLYKAYLTNTVRQVPYVPYLTLYDYTTWQANDPLVHYLASDLSTTFLDASPPTGLSYTFRPPVIGTYFGAIPNLSSLNERYQPWGRNRSGLNLDNNAYNANLKDPLVWDSDNWNFPAGQSSGSRWLGRVHRGTPWQTIYLKAMDILAETNSSAGYSFNIGIPTWTNWTGNANIDDARAMAPTSDWRLAGLVASLFNTNDLSSLQSVNNANPAAWQATFDGLIAITNDAAFDPIVVSSNSSQAALIANAIESVRQTLRGQFFRDAGDVLSVPELSNDSPFLDWNSLTQQQLGISDEADEALPAQLLSLIRSDSVGAIVAHDGAVQIQFTGYDNHPYAVEMSSNLFDWIAISTNDPVNGVLTLTNPAATDAARFYRTRLLN